MQHGRPKAEPCARSRRSGEDATGPNAVYAIEHLLHDIRLARLETCMAELKWLDGYSGESTDALIALENEYHLNSLVLAFEQALNQKAARLGIGSLTAEECAILAVEALEREVNNGGYSQFFFNSSSGYAPIVVEALERIGCPEAARLTKRAIDAFGVDPTTPSHSYRDAIVDLTSEREEALGRCDTEYYAVVGDLAGPLFQFIKRERGWIVLN
jgi:Domain of unknown function (DUF4375)